MNQPQLGKKIAELRKAKGYTQEELVILCKLNVRTLQRIESGEVTPRSYTLKIIFTALDSNFYDELNGTNDTVGLPETVSPSRLEQIYRYVLDLLNFKKNTMKKLLISSAIMLCMVFIFADFSKAQTPSFDKAKLVGTWIQCDPAGNPVQTGSGLTEYKIITPETFAILEINKDKDKAGLIGMFYGTYSLVNDTYIETIDYTNPNLENYKGINNTFKIEFKGDLWYLKGVNNPYKQVWKKIDRLVADTK